MGSSSCSETHFTASSNGVVNLELNPKSYADQLPELNPSNLYEVLCRLLWARSGGHVEDLKTHKSLNSSFKVEIESEREKERDP